MGVPTYAYGSGRPVITWVCLRNSHENLGFAHKIQLPVWVCPLLKKKKKPGLPLAWPINIYNTYVWGIQAYPKPNLEITVSRRYEGKYHT